MDVAHRYIKTISLDGKRIVLRELYQAVYKYNPEFKHFKGPRRFDEALRILRQNGHIVEVEYVFRIVE